MPVSSILMQRHADDPRIAGSKAARLAALAAAGFRVPPFFVVPAPEASRPADPCAQRRDVRDALRRLAPDGARVAVRSSSPDEDGRTRSFAGQFRSFLDVEHAHVLARIGDVKRSAECERVRHYRSATGVVGAAAAPAVIVQVMVPAAAAGVAFAADPVSGDRELAVIAAKRGLGDNLVDGECQGDTWRVDARGRVVDWDLDDPAAPALTVRQIRAVAKLVRDVSHSVGRPQDIEWAIERRRVYLLQSRDITTLAYERAEDSWALWDNSNIVESYGGVTAPLTFSIARSAYAAAYRHFGRVIGVAEPVIRSNERTYEQMIGLIDGRVYYNLRNWYRLLMQTPGFRFNKRFMEQMMGVTQAMPASSLPAPVIDAPFARVRAAFGMIRIGWRLLKQRTTHARRVVAFHATIDRLLAKVPLETYPLEALMDYYDSLQAQVIPAWNTPLLNDLYCMISHGSLRRLCASWLPAPLAEVHNDLVGGEPQVISMEPVRCLKRMAVLASRDQRLVAVLESGTAADVHRALADHADFDRAYRDYLHRFGDRCIDELKLESPTLEDDPLPLLRAVAGLARMAATSESENRATRAARVAAEARVAAAMRGRPIRYRLFRLALALTRAHLRDRENLRFERTRVYGRVRGIFVEIGKRLQDAGVIAAVDDVFYLDLREIAGFIRGTGSSSALAAVCRARRVEFDRYRAMPDPPRRFLTRGPAQLEASRQTADEPGAAAGSSAARRGQPCSPGTVRGPVRIVTEPRTAELAPGDILVAERTDPGWVTLFPLASGLIMERGSLLSHSAIVARELNLPCVVGVAGACRWLEDGEWVEVDGGAGTIRRLAVDDEVA